MSHNLKSALQEHYQSIELNSVQLSQLKSRRMHVWSWSRHGVVAAACSLLLAGTLFFGSKLYSTPVISQIAKEVHYNHKKDMPSEVLTSDYNELNVALDRLDFKVVPSQRLAGKVRLLGGRYCSIQGKIAAQLKVQHQDHVRPSTLYLFKDVSDYELQNAVIEQHQTDVRIEIWREGALGFALAIDQPDPY